MQLEECQLECNVIEYEIKFCPMCSHPVLMEGIYQDCVWCEIHKNYKESLDEHSM